MKARITYAALAVTAAGAAVWLVYRIVVSIVEATVKLAEIGEAAWL